jgi:hypothetical protein
MKNKCLIIILGHARASELTWKSFKSNVFDALNADLALCVGESEDNNDSNPYWQQAKYKWTSPEYENYADGYDKFQKKYGGTNNWRELLDFAPQYIAPFLGGCYDEHHKPAASAGILIYYRALALEYITNLNLDSMYDRFLITRSDFIWQAKHPDLSKLNAEKIWIAYGETYGGVTDRYALLNDKDVFTYLDLLRPIVTDHIILKSKLMDFDKDQLINMESYIKFHLIDNKVFKRVRFTPYYMFTVRDKDSPGRWSKGTFNKKLDCFIKYPEEKTMADIYATYFPKTGLLNSFKLYPYNLAVYRIIHVYAKVKRRLLKQQIEL